MYAQFTKLQTNHMLTYRSTNVACGPGKAPPKTSHSDSPINSREEKKEYEKVPYEVCKLTDILVRIIPS